MKSYIQPTSEEQRLMDNVSVPAGAYQRVRKSFHKATETTRWFTLALKMAVIPAVIVVAVAVSLYGRPEGATLPLSFMEQAIAASRVKAEMMGSDSVRHIVIVENKNLGNGLERDMWLSADGLSWFETTSALTDQMRDVEVVQAFIDGVQYVTPEYYQGEIERQAAQARHPVDVDVREPMLHFTHPVGAVASGGITKVTETGWIVCQASTMGLESAIAGQTIEQRVGELLGFGRQMNVVPNFADAIAELARSPLVQDMGEKMMDGIGAAHVYRLSYQDTGMNDYDTVITRGTDYIFSTDTKELKAITHWYKDPEDYNEGRSTMLIVKDEILELSSLTTNPFDLSTNGLVAASIDDVVVEERHPRIEITLPEDGCYTVRKDDLSFEKIADTEEEARERGLLDRH